MNNTDMHVGHVHFAAVKEITKKIWRIIPEYFGTVLENNSFAFNLKLMSRLYHM